VIERPYRSGEKVDEVRLERRTFEFLYRDDNQYVFMDTETYDQIQIEGDMVGEARKFLAENMVCQILFHGEVPIEVEPPTFVELEIIGTEPGFKGNTAQNTTKPATVTTGAVIYVPLFVEVGTVVKIDTRTGDYIERVSK
jgi:elongation factor P